MIECFIFIPFSLASPAADVSEGEKPKANVNKTQISFDELKSLIVDGKVTLVDVREPEDLQNTGCLPNCINIPCEDQSELLLVCFRVLTID